MYRKYQTHCPRTGPLKCISAKKSFLVIGETGVGKTNAVNHLTGNDFETSSSAAGVTFDFQEGIHKNGHRLIDTVGLSESDKGTVHPAVAFAKLAKFVKDSRDGFNGIFLVVDRPRVTKAMEENYRLFVKDITRNKVPCYLFINKQELEEAPPFQRQYNMNEKIYNRNGMCFADGFAGGFKTDEARNFTLSRFDECIANSPETKERLYDENDFMAFVKGLWQSFLEWLWGEDYLPPPEDNTIEGIYVKMGVPRKLARQMARKMDALSDEDIDQLALELKKLNKKEE